MLIDLLESSKAFGLCPMGISTQKQSSQKQSSGLEAHENSTFRNLALAVSGPFMA